MQEHVELIIDFATTLTRVFCRGDTPHGYENAYYHVMARDNRREPVFTDDEDRHFFLQTLGQGGGMTGWRVHAWVLMGNHYHLLVQTPEPNLATGMSWLQNTCTRRFNARHKLWGRLFGDRYKAVLVGGSGYYYETLLDHIHLNPLQGYYLAPARTKHHGLSLEQRGGSVCISTCKTRLVDGGGG